MKRTLLCGLVIACSTLTGCASFMGHGDGQTSTGMFPWSKPKPQNAPAVAPDASLTSGIAKGMNLERAGQYEKAREVYNKILRDDPNNAAATHRLAVVADKQRRYDEAQVLYLRAIQLEPTNAEMFNDLGFCFYSSGQLQKAESALVKAIRLDPTSQRFHINLGLVLGGQGRLEEAFEEFKSAGSEADAHFNMAFVYAAQQRTEEAKDCFRRALAHDPSHEKARKQLENFERFEQNGGMMLDEEFTADGRRLIPYVETPGGEPDVARMAEFGLHRSMDSALPGGTHNMPANRDAGAATRSLHDSSRGLADRNMASVREADVR